MLIKKDRMIRGGGAGGGDRPPNVKVGGHRPPKDDREYFCVITVVREIFVLLRNFRV